MMNTGIDTLRRALKAREISAPELKKETLKAVEKENQSLNAFIALDASTAAEFDESLALSGIPIAVKDNICTRDLRTTCASEMLKGFQPGYDAHAVELLRRAGAVIVGKTNMDEFGMGSTSENSAFGAVMNPVKCGHVPGGSSGGSAAAVAAGLVPAALGSDTGGSVRQPASHCGIVGFKPSYGAVSRFGLVAFASSMDQIGVLGKTVNDAEQVARVIFGKDSKDQTSCRVSHAQVRINPSSVRVGISREYNSAADTEVDRAVRRAADIFQSLGAQIVEVSLPMTEYLLPIYYILSSAEASSNLARFDGIKYGLGGTDRESVDALMASARCAGFGDEVKRRILLGTFVLSEGYYADYYRKAERARARLRAEYSHVLSAQCDVLLSPVAKTCAPKLGELSGCPSRMHESDYYTVAANLTGMPAISIPVGESRGGLPIGVQLMSARGTDAWLLAAASAVEEQVKGGAGT